MLLLDSFRKCVPDRSFSKSKTPWIYFTTVIVHIEDSAHWLYATTSCLATCAVVDVSFLTKCRTFHSRLILLFPINSYNNHYSHTGLPITNRSSDGKTATHRAYLLLCLLVYKEGSTWVLQATGPDTNMSGLRLIHDPIRTEKLSGQSSALPQNSHTTGLWRSTCTHEIHCNAFVLFGEGSQAAIQRNLPWLHVSRPDRLRWNTHVATEQVLIVRTWLLSLNNSTNLMNEVHNVTSFPSRWWPLCAISIPLPQPFWISCR